MGNKNYTDMSNSEIKICIERLRNEFESRKIKLKEICKEMDTIERDYINATHELEMRRKIYF